MSSKKMVVATACAVMAASLLGMTGCDTVARIPFSDRGFRTILPLSMTAAGDNAAQQCGGVDLASLDNANARMTMVLLDDSSHPIKLGEEMRVQIGNQMHAEFVEPEAGDFGFSGGRLYSFPDLPCESNDDCPTPMGCNDVDGSGQSWCTDNDRLEGISVIGEPRYVGEEPQSQALAVVISEAGRWRGYYDIQLYNGFYHFDPDEEANTPLEAQPIREAAVDPDGVRINALNQVASTWGNLNEYVSEDGRTAHFGLWTFASENAAVQSRVAEVSPSGSMWTGDVGNAEQAASRVNNTDSRQARGNVFRSALTALNQGFDNNAQVQNAEAKSMVLIVGGHDERRQADVDDLIARANELDVSISVVQIDRERNPASHILRDDWRYYDEDGGTVPQCSDDSDCENYQACRAPARYTRSASSTNPNDVVHPTDLDATWCLPTYDDKGRIGPIAEYDRLACETGGAYFYIPEPREALINDALAAVVYGKEAAWEVDMFLDIDTGGQFGPGEPVLMETELQATVVANSTRRFERPTDAAGDTRRVFFTPANSGGE